MIGFFFFDKKAGGLLIYRCAHSTSATEGGVTLNTKDEILLYQVSETALQEARILSDIEEFTMILPTFFHQRWQTLLTNTMA